MYLALADGPAIFTQDFSCPMLLRINPRRLFSFEYGAITLYGAPFQEASSTKKLFYFFPPEAVWIFRTPLVILKIRSQKTPLSFI